MNGGVRVNEFCETCIKNLYVAGEALRGLHGANRLGGNSIPATQVFGARAGLFAAKIASEMKAFPEVNWEQVDEERDRVYGILNRTQTTRSVRAWELKAQLQRLMWNDVGIVRNGLGLKKAIETIELMKKQFNENLAVSSSNVIYNWDWIEALEVYNMLNLAWVIAKAALIREESRGSHFREDYPQTDNKRWWKNIIAWKREDEILFRKEQVVVISDVIPQGV
jgi:succinate dehydrogenase/fumarate reductase flavoprotein subunit